MFSGEINKQYQTVSAKVRNPSAGAISVSRENLIGQPVKLVTGNWTFVLDGDEANAEAVVYQGEPITALAASGDTPTECTILVRGPIVLKKSGMVANDVEGDALNATTLATALLALSPPMVTVDDTSQVKDEASI